MTERDRLESELRIALRAYRDNPTDANNASVNAISDRMLDNADCAEKHEIARADAWIAYNFNTTLCPHGVRTVVCGHCN
jgi:hypothetical protein